MPFEQLNREGQAGSYPIREFARLTGVSPATLRAWERRHGIIQPLRTDKGHRFYTGDQVMLVRKILDFLKQGYAVEQVKPLLTETSTMHNPADHWAELQQQLLDCLDHWQPARLNQLLDSGFSQYPLPIYFDFIIEPVVALLARTPPSLLLEHQLLQRLWHRIHQQQRQSGDLRVLFIADNGRIEPGLLARASAIASAGLDVQVLAAPNMGDALADIVRITSADALWLHGSGGPATAQQCCLDNCLDKPLWISGRLSARVRHSQQRDVTQLGMQSQIQACLTGLATSINPLSGLQESFND